MSNSKNSLNFHANPSPSLSLYSPILSSPEAQFAVTSTSFPIVENISFPRPLIVRFTEYNYCKLVEAILRETSEGTSY
uniref:Uncharacterized protein n=1 Tax=Panagrolaimus sp. ES5 TaxID=591445 RepID=A0AC34G9J5_9BILA